MKNSSKKNADQVRFFDLIQQKLPANYALVDAVSELLNIGSDASYRRIRGAKELDFKEISILCKHFRISFDTLMYSPNNHSFDCTYRSIDLSIPGEYQNYMLALSKNIERTKIASDSSIFMSATDIPVFHLITQKELTFFKVYTWFHSVYNHEDSLDDFMKNFETPEILGCFQQISRNYELIPSSEIWTQNTIQRYIVINKLLYRYLCLFKSGTSNVAMRAVNEYFSQNPEMDGKQSKRRTWNAVSILCQRNGIGKYLHLDETIRRI